eukprot:5659693-Amphidinium_carterae.1
MLAPHLRRRASRCDCLRLPKVTAGSGSPYTYSRGAPRWDYSYCSYVYARPRSASYAGNNPSMQRVWAHLFKSFALQ